jgi:hypothetical protein
MDSTADVPNLGTRVERHGAAVGGVRARLKARTVLLRVTSDRTDDVGAVLVIYMW